MRVLYALQSSHRIDSGDGGFTHSPVCSKYDFNEVAGLVERELGKVEREENGWLPACFTHELRT